MINDPVRSPSHYVLDDVPALLPDGTLVRATVECRDVIDALDLGRWEAFAFKYLWRARSKGKHVEDLRKAVECIGFAVEGLTTRPPIAAQIVASDYGDGDGLVDVRPATGPRNE